MSRGRKKSAKQLLDELPAQEEWDELGVDREYVKRLIEEDHIVRGED